MVSQEYEGSSRGEWVFSKILYIITGVMFLLLVKDSVKDLRRRFYVSFLNWWAKDVDPKTQEYKREIFADISSNVSHDPELRKSGGLKILEIGVGSGANFEFYPEGTKLLALDPNPHFIQHFNQNRKKFPNIQSEEIIVSTGEEMYMVPDNSIDVVVVTMVFCCVSNTQKVLKEILRVLAPGGKFYFLEHIGEFDKTHHSMRRKAQELLTRTGVWPFFFDNCHLNRDLLDDIRAAGFSKVKAKKYYSHNDNFLYQLCQPCVKGIAEK